MASELDSFSCCAPSRIARNYWSRKSLLTNRSRTLGDTAVSMPAAASHDSSKRLTIDPISLMIARFAAAVEVGNLQDSPLVDLETAKTLEFVFTALAASKLDSTDMALSQDPKNYPGHLITKIASRTVYIPFHLIEIVPSEKILEILVQQAEAIRIFQDSTICLSGSAIYGLEAAGDIDFCEYVPHTGKRVAQRFLAKENTTIPFCTEIRHGDNRITYPWDRNLVLDLCVTDNGHIGGKCTCPKREWKFDYVGHLHSMGAVPLSNICIHEDDAEALSWSF